MFEVAAGTHVRTLLDARSRQSDCACANPYTFVEDDVTARTHDDLLTVVALVHALIDTRFFLLQEVHPVPLATR